MDDAKWERWAALGGIAFAVMIAITMILPGTPPKTSDSAAKITNFVTDNGDEIRWATYVGSLAIVALFWWLGSVWRLMRRSEGESARLAVVALSGAVFASVMATIGGIILGLMPIVGTRNLGLQGTRTFYILSTNIAMGTLFGLAVFLGAFSALIIRTHMLAPVMGWLGAVLALVALCGGAAVTTTRDVVFVAAFAGFVGFVLWVLVVSILMLRGPRERVTAAP